MPVDKLRISSLYSDLNRCLESLRANRSAVLRSRERVEQGLAGEEAIYGVNTGFGALARQRIPAEQLEQLQRNLLISHAVGVGEPVPKEISRLMLGLKIHSLGLGYSGISWGTLERLLVFEEKGWIPVVPSRGSVGASGDLAPLAHMSLPLIGLGEFWDETGKQRLDAGEFLARNNFRPVTLKAKDGLSLINGTQLMSAYGAFVLERALHLVKLADVLAGMSLEALQGSVKPFDQRIQEVRPHPGAALTSRNVRGLLVDSQILESHRNCGKVQDPYCLRCVPQVHGASRDAIEHAVQVVEVELNSVTDNPLVFEDGEIISGGNFHGQPLALVLDYAALALAELASISERRIYLLLEGHDGLPRLLMKNTGINSGFMMPQYTAAALVSENKVLCHPACVDSIPTSLGQEDHVSMGSISALKLFEILKNVETVLAVELLTAAQALDYRQPLRPGRGVLAAHEFLRSIIPHREEDDLLQNDLQRCLELVREKRMVDAVEETLGGLV